MRHFLVDIEATGTFNMITINENFDRSLLYLSSVLPPIKYSRNGINVSLIEDIGEILYTEGIQTDNAVRFKNFLHLRGALLPYITNALALGDTAREGDGRNNINTAFTWSHTPEKHSYWESLHFEWLRQER